MELRRHLRRHAVAHGGVEQQRLDFVPRARLRGQIGETLDRRRIARLRARSPRGSGAPPPRARRAATPPRARPACSSARRDADGARSPVHRQLARAPADRPSRHRGAGARACRAARSLRPQHFGSAFERALERRFARRVVLAALEVHARRVDERARRAARAWPRPPPRARAPPRSRPSRRRSGAGAPARRARADRRAPARAPSSSVRSAVVAVAELRPRAAPARRAAAPARPSTVPALLARCAMRVRKTSACSSGCPARPSARSSRSATSSSSGLSLRSVAQAPPPRPS